MTNDGTGNIFWLDEVFLGINFGVLQPRNIEFVISAASLRAGDRPRTATTVLRLERRRTF